MKTFSLFPFVYVFVNEYYFSYLRQFHCYKLCEYSGKIPMSWQGLIDMQALPATPTRTSVPNGSSTVIPPPSILGPWKCWGGLAGHAASEGKGNDHPIVTSACWYLDFDSEWNDYLRVDPVATAREAPVPSSSPTRAPAEEEHTTHPPSMSQLPSAVLDTKVSLPSFFCGHICITVYLLCHCV